MLLKLELSDTFWLSLPGFAGNISSCTQHSRRAAPLDLAPVMQSCAARLNARPAKQSVNCELLCIIPLCTFTTSESMRSCLGCSHPRAEIKIKSPKLVVGYFETNLRKRGSTQIVSPRLPVTDSMFSSAMPTSLNPATTNSWPTHFSKVAIVGKSG